MGRTTDKAIPPEWEEPVAVIGGGVSGRAVASLLGERSVPCTVFDEAGVNGAERTFSPEGFGSFVLSPGFPPDHPWRRAAENSGLPCFGELGLAASLWRGPVIGVTGTNGKTTLTGLLVAAFAEAGRPAAAVGNIGRPLAAVVDGPADDGRTVAVCEISSFQAESPRGLRLDGLIWTNFGEDHLDRYADMGAYFAAKARLFGCLRSGAPCLVGSAVERWARRLAYPLPKLATVVPAPADGFPQLDSGCIFASGFQAENFALARAWFRAGGLPEEALGRAAERFEPPPHRLRRIAAAGGLECWSDSKATNFDAALAAMDRIGGKIHWIGGGSPKGGDVDGFARRVAHRVAAAYVYGEAGHLLAEGLRRAGCPVRLSGPFGEAVEAAFAGASADLPAVLLLSPGFASFDQFDGYAERGKTFESMVLGLMRGNPGS